MLTKVDRGWSLQMTFVDDSVSIEDAHQFGHTHITEVGTLLRPLTPRIVEEE